MYFHPTETPHPPHRPSSSFPNHNKPQWNEHISYRVSRLLDTNIFEIQCIFALTEAPSHPHPDPSHPPSSPITMCRSRARINGRPDNGRHQDIRRRSGRIEEWSL